MTEKDPDPAAEAPAAAPETSPQPETSILSPLRERFCRYYLTEPSATRAAVRAGYAPRGAGQQAHRLLKNVEILQRIDAVRRSEHLVYALSPQAVMDRCEAIFEESLEKGRFEAAIGALRLQAKVGGLLRHDALPATKQDLAGVVDYAVRTAVAKYVAFGTVGALNPLAPPPWAPGEEAARRKRRQIEREQAEAEAEARAKAGWPPQEGTLGWPGDEAAMFRAAVGHEDAYQRAHDLDPVTPVHPRWAPEEVRVETERAYALGRTPDPDAPAPDRAFPPDESESE
jgi:hypothetical protein